MLMTAKRMRCESQVRPHDSTPMIPQSSRHGPRSHRRASIHVVWLLIVLSLIPGGALAVFRDEWQGLPAGVQWAAYLLSAILLAAACSLALGLGDERGSGSKQDSRDRLPQCPPVDPGVRDQQGRANDFSMHLGAAACK
jgi:hypothetical protein